MKQEIKQMSQIEHCIARPSMYIGSVVNESQSEFLLKEGNFVLDSRNYISGLVKLFDEIIDNSVDEYVRTKGKHANKINIKMNSTSFECSDNGRGIPNTTMKTLNGDTKYQAEVAFTEMLSGANYDNNDEATIGTNGLGSKVASIFSTKSVIKNDDGETCVTITTKDHLSDVNVSSSASKISGVNTKIYPDLEYFGITELDDTYVSVMQERLMHLSISYPDISFRFNGKAVKLNTKSYFGMFNATEFVNLNDNVSIAITHSPSDQFEHFSLVNGLITKDGGTHVTLLSNEIINPIRSKLVKKFKTIKPGDVRQKLRVILIFKNFMNTRYKSQTKTQITNSAQEVKDFLGDYSKILEKFTAKLLRNDNIMLPITELFMLKEQAKANVELRKLNNGPKRIKSEKYLPATGNKKYLMIAEGACLEENTDILMSDYSIKKIKDIDIGDRVISGDLSVETVQAKVKLMKETISIKTASGTIVCGKEHKFRVYDTTDNIFKFETAKNIKLEFGRYKMIKSKVNSESRYLEVQSNNDMVITVQGGEVISYTGDDYSVIMRDAKITRIKTDHIIESDLIMMSVNV